jgi:glycosyltransferase 2 family protein
MKKRLILFLGFLILGIALFTAVIFKTGLNEIWNNLRHFSFLNFLFFLFLSTLNFGLYTLRWDIILRHIHEPHPKIPFPKLFLHRMSAFALSYLTPTAQTGGEPLRIMLLQDDNVSAKTATASVIIDKALEFAALFVFIAVGITLALLDGSLPSKTEFLFTIILVIIVTLIFWFYYSSVKDIGFFSSILRFTRLTKISRIKIIEQKFIEIERQMASFYKKHLKVFLFLILISLLISAFLLLEHYLVARFMGVRLSFFQTFLCSTIPYIAFMVPIPGGLGLLESGHAAVFAMLGVNINAFVLVFIIRMRDFVFVTIGLIHASKQGAKMLKEAFFNK